MPSALPQICQPGATTARQQNNRYQAVLSPKFTSSPRYTMLNDSANF